MADINVSRLIAKKKDWERAFIWTQFADAIPVIHDMDIKVSGTDLIIANPKQPASEGMTVTVHIHLKLSEIRRIDYINPNLIQAISKVRKIITD